MFVFTILGAKQSKGEFDGRKFDSTKLFYQADLKTGNFDRIKI